MAQLVEDCPRCGTSRIAFEVKSEVLIKRVDWQNQYELFCICGHCRLSTVFFAKVANVDASRVLIATAGGILGVIGSINRFVRIDGYVSSSDKAASPAPEFLPDNVLAAFNEGAKCMAVGCYNAAGTMFRLCVDMTTKDKLPEGEVEGLNYKTRRDLGLRLPWLFDHGYLPEDLRDLSHCIKEDGNDGAHQGTLTEHDALDLLDFTTALLERVYTQPERLRQAADRRATRRAT